MQIALFRRADICQSVVEVKLTGVSDLEAVSRVLKDLKLVKISSEATFNRP